MKKLGQEKSWLKRQKLISWFLVLVWAGVIFFMSSRSDSGLSQDMSFFSVLYQSLMGAQEYYLGTGVDVLSPAAHFCEYLIFGLLLVRAFNVEQTLSRAFFLALVIASVYALSDEIHQWFVPGRTCDPLDWLVDVIGASVGAGLLCGWMMWRRRKQSVDN